MRLSFQTPVWLDLRRSSRVDLCWILISLNDDIQIYRYRINTNFYRVSTHQIRRGRRVARPSTSQESADLRSPMRENERREPGDGWAGQHIRQSFFSVACRLPGNNSDSEILVALQTAETVVSSYPETLS